MGIALAKDEVCKARPIGAGVACPLRGKRPDGNCFGRVREPRKRRSVGVSVAGPLRGNVRMGTALAECGNLVSDTRSESASLVPYEGTSGWELLWPSAEPRKRTLGRSERSWSPTRELPDGNCFGRVREPRKRTLGRSERSWSQQRESFRLGSTETRKRQRLPARPVMGIAPLGELPAGS
jgi:hypothetical protein